jgi:hypothetical protein
VFFKAHNIAVRLFVFGLAHVAKPGIGTFELARALDLPEEFLYPVSIFLSQHGTLPAGMAILSRRSISGCYACP